MQIDHNTINKINKQIQLQKQRKAVKRTPAPSVYYKSPYHCVTKSQYLYKIENGEKCDETNIKTIHGEDRKIVMICDGVNVKLYGAQITTIRDIYYLHATSISTDPWIFAKLYTVIDGQLSNGIRALIDHIDYKSLPNTLVYDGVERATDDVLRELIENGIQMYKLITTIG